MTSVLWGLIVVAILAAAWVVFVFALTFTLLMRHRFVSAQYVGVAERDVQLTAFTECYGMLYAWTWDDKGDGESGPGWVNTPLGCARARGQVARSRFPAPNTFEEASK